MFSLVNAKRTSPFHSLEEFCFLENPVECEGLQQKLLGLYFFMQITSL